MLCQNDIPAFIACQIPEVKKELSGGSKQPTAYAAIQALTDYTKRMACQHEFIKVKNCMSLVQQIYKRGNTQVKNAVENIFIFAFSSILPRCRQLEWQLVQSCMPPELYALYVRQVMKVGC
jgi:hypothetical protein